MMTNGLTAFVTAATAGLGEAATAALPTIAGIVAIGIAASFGLGYVKKLLKA
jgi:hypothetical protein